MTNEEEQRHWRYRSIGQGITAGVITVASGFISFIIAEIFPFESGINVIKIFLTLAIILSILSVTNALLWSKNLFLGYLGEARKGGRNEDSNELFGVGDFRLKVSINMFILSLFFGSIGLIIEYWSR